MNNIIYYILFSNLILINQFILYTYIILCKKYKLNSINKARFDDDQDQTKYNFGKNKIHIISI